MKLAKIDVECLDRVDDQSRRQGAPVDLEQFVERPAQVVVVEQIQLARLDLREGWVEPLQPLSNAIERVP